MERKILNVFIASPSDLNEERRTIRDVVERINKVFGRNLNIQIDLLGWEDTTPGFNRPQSIINEDVVRCNLFIGLLYKRWGSNSGEYSSGFEEEFEITRKRNLDNENVDIWLFFKKIEKDLLLDPGEQLKKVIDFKKEQTLKKELLYKDFENTKEFGEIIYDSLSSHLLEISDNKNNDSLNSAPLNIEKIDSNTEDQFEKSNPQLEISNCYHEIINNKEEEVKFWTSLRAYFSSFSIYSNFHSTELFDTHAFHYIYRMRKIWNFSETERKFIIRSVCGNRNKNMSGWYWIKNESSFNIIQYLEKLSIYDYNKEVEIGAIKLLKTLNYIPSFEFIKRLLTEVDNTSEKLLEIISLTYNINDKETDLLLIELEELFNSTIDSVRKLAINTYIKKSYKKYPKKSFMIFCKNSSDTTDLYKELLEELNFNIDEKEMISLGFASKKHVRLYSADYLYKKDAITIDLAKSLLLDTESQIRKIGFEFLLDNGTSFSLKETRELFPKSKNKSNSLALLNLDFEISEKEMIPLVLKKKTPEELLSLIDFYTDEGCMAYQVLAEEHDDKYFDLFRKNLKDNFEKMKEESRSKIIDKFGEHGKKLIDDFNSDNIKYIKRGFYSASIIGLRNNYKKSDIEFIRDYIKEEIPYPNLNDALEILNNIGNALDVKILLNVARKHLLINKKDVIECAYKLSKNKENFVTNLLDEDNKALAIYGFDYISSVIEYKRIHLLHKCIRDENEQFRLRAIEELAKLWGHNKLEEFLDEYIEEGQYYYNNVLYLDEYLYS